MPNNIAPSIGFLPVELLHRIFDNLDAQTIALSVRSVSRLFRSVVNSYDRYVWDFKSISKSNFYVLCRLIQPQNVVTLTLSNGDRTTDQIALFLSLVRIRQLTRLRSLTLQDIDESQLNFILKRVQLNCLTSFSFNIRKYENRRIETSTNLLSRIIAQPSLRKLEFNISIERMSKISWPTDCSIHQLIINDRMTLDNLCTILQCSPHLHKLIINQNFDAILNNIVPAFSFPTSFGQLKSLIFNNLEISMDKLESFLLLTPSVVYLKLIGGGPILDGKRWEQFIGINLPQLDKFEFYTEEWNSIYRSPADIELTIASFRTPFWIEHKKWFIACEYQLGGWGIYIYSLPICKSVLHYKANSRKVVLSTMTSDNHSTVMDNINSLNLSLSQTIVDDIHEKVFTFELI
jgi:hypothetical protein